jgi:putative transposase
MPSAYLSLHYHLVFSTKHRAPTITLEMAPRLYEYLGGIVRKEGGQLLTVGGMPDHVHLLVRLGATRAISDVLRAIKAGSSGWVHDTFTTAAGFGWQTGYGAFTVSRSNLDAVRQYIEHQEEHHRTRTFQEEFLELLVKHEVEFDEQYLWD